MSNKVHTSSTFYENLQLFTPRYTILHNTIIYIAFFKDLQKKGSTFLNHTSLCTTHRNHTSFKNSAHTIYASLHYNTFTHKLFYRTYPIHTFTIRFHNLRQYSQHFAQLYKACFTPLFYIVENLYKTSFNIFYSTLHRKLDNHFIQLSSTLDTLSKYK